MIEITKDINISELKNNLQSVNKDKNLYVVFFKTPFKMGKFIRFFTKYKYNHVAISFEDDLKTLYSFARYNKNSPFVGGFVEESPYRYINNILIYTPIKIFKIPITYKDYSHLQEIISFIKKNKDDYIYNLFSAMLYPFKKNIEINKAYNCIDFVTYILKSINVLQDVNVNYNFRELDYILNNYIMYEGNIKEIIKNTPHIYDTFFINTKKRTIFKDTFKSIYKLSKRIVTDSK